MLPPVLTREQVRLFDRIAVEQFGIPSLVLMENAARGAVDFLCESHGTAAGRAVIVCGTGNNGGDGLAMARHLHLRGWSPSVVLLPGGQRSPDAVANLAILRRTRVPIAGADSLSGTARADLVAGADWLVDALTGTGARLPLGEPFGTWISLLNSAAGRRMAVDIPSGLDCDAVDLKPEVAEASGFPVIRADITATFVALKPVMGTEAGKLFCGETTIVDIGAPPEVLDYLPSTPSGRQAD